jgi:hypothetical protein
MHNTLYMADSLWLNVDLGFRALEVEMELIALQSERGRSYNTQLVIPIAIPWKLWEMLYSLRPYLQHFD